MPTKKASAIVVSESDYERLCSMIENKPSSASDALEEELNRARIVPNSKYPRDAVCMNSTVVFEDIDSGEQEKVSLVFPHEARVEEMKISVLSPVGSALIGLRVNGEITWPLERGKVRNIRILEVRQPDMSPAI